MLSPTKPLDQIQLNLVCELLTCMGRAIAKNLACHLGPWGGVKRSDIIKFQLQSQFQRFLNQTLCVFSQMIDTKHIRQDFYSVAWVMPKWWDLGVHRGHPFNSYGIFS